MKENSAEKTEVCNSPEALRFKVEGYSLCRQVLSAEMLDKLREKTYVLLAKQSPEDRAQFPYQGSMVPVDYKDPVFAELISNERSLEALHNLGFEDPKWMSGYIISKPPHSPPLWWHQDWWAWDEPCSLQETSPQAFLMYYLTDTTPENGCLRVIPKSHRAYTDLHDKLPPPHTEEINSMALDSPAFEKHPREIDVPVHAGDAIVGDARLLHAAHANMSDQDRTCITLWYLPDFDHLPSNIQSYVVQHHCLPSVGWWHQQQSVVSPKLKKLLPVYDGEQRAVAFNRDPRQALRRLLSAQQSDST